MRLTPKGKRRIAPLLQEASPDELIQASIVAFLDGQDEHPLFQLLHTPDDELHTPDDELVASEATTTEEVASEATTKERLRLIAIYKHIRWDLVSGCWLRVNEEGKPVTNNSDDLRVIMKWSTHPEAYAHVGIADDCPDRVANVVRHHPWRCELLHKGPLHGACCRPSHLCFGSRHTNTSADIQRANDARDSDAFSAAVQTFRAALDRSAKEQLLAEDDKWHS